MPQAPAPRHGHEATRARQRAPQRARGHAERVQVDIDQQKASALGLSLADVNATLRGLGRRLRQRLHRQGPRQARLHAGRRAFRMVPEDVNRWYVRNAPGRDGALLRLRTPASGPGSPQARALQRHRRGPSSGSRRPATAPARRWPRWRSSSAAPGGHRLRVVGPFATRSGSPAPTPGALRARCSSSSSASPPSTRAGRSRSR